MNPCGIRSKSIPVRCPFNWLRSVSKMVASISISMTAIWSILNPIWLMSQLESNWNICVLVEIMMNRAPNSIMSRMKWRKNAKIMMLWCISLWNQAIWNHWRSYLTKKFYLTWIHLFSIIATPWRTFVSALWSWTFGTWS